MTPKKAPQKTPTVSRKAQPKSSAKPSANRAAAHKAPARKTISSATSKGKKVTLLSSALAYSGPLFDVYTDFIREPGGTDSRRDVIRHSGSVVVLAVDDSKNKKDPLVLLERQYRHAAGQYMWELPAGRKEPQEAVLPGAKRELMEETGYRARRWTKLLRFYASPGFLGEWMQIYLAEGLAPGPTQPDEDEYIECQMVPLSEALRWVESNKIIDGKSMIALLLYDRLRRTRR
jgi:ADP-ribose pyrophosphatase